MMGTALRRRGWRNLVHLGPWVLGLGILGACAGEKGGSETTDADTLTRHQKDSLLSTMPIPGAGAVGQALDAAEKTEERARQLDTVG